MTGISVLIPVHNAGPQLVDTIYSVLHQFEEVALPYEIVIVDDTSADGAVAKVRCRFTEVPVTVVSSRRRGAAAALNAGLEVARFPLIAQVDQDVVLHAGWLAQLVACLDASDVAAVQGQYVTDPGASLFSRVMGRDLEDRYASLGTETGHVCTGNTLYRAAALREIGGFDEALGYGYDNDASYRLGRAGGRLVYCAGATSTHRWREGFAGYLRQQYGFGYGRLDVVARHRDRIGGDSVSPAMMMLHPVLAGASVLLGLLGAIAPDAWSLACAATALAIVMLLVCERMIAGLRASMRTKDWVPLLFPIVHLARDAAWVTAIAVWSVRRIAGVAVSPHHSMFTRPATDDATR